MEKVVPHYRQKPMVDVPHFFRCPISMELMQDPVTVSTGVTYERKNIERWLLTYKKTTCPATMQRLDTLDLTPNHTLRRFIASWSDLPSHTPSSSASPTPPPLSADLAPLLSAVESAPFKVASLRKLRSAVAVDDEAAAAELVTSGGVEVLSGVILQVLMDSSGIDFAAFDASEEALAVLYHLLPQLSGEASLQPLSTPEFIKSMTVVLQRGSAEAQLHAVTILQRVAGAGRDDWAQLLGDQEMEFFKSLLELLSDEASTKAGACALDVLVDVMGASKKSRLKAVELGAARLLVELLPESNSRHRCERMLLLLKMLCEFPEGRSAFAEHGMAVAAVSKKVLRVSDAATKLGVKVLWLVCSFHPTEKVLDEMMVFGAVKKLLALLHIDARSSTKERAMKVLKLHAGVWRQYPCFPCELKDCLRLMHDSR